VSGGPSGLTAATPIPQVVAAQPRRRVPEGAVKQAILIPFLIVLAALFLYPFIWLISASLKPQGDVFDNRLIPKTFQWNYGHGPYDAIGRGHGLFALVPEAPHWLFNTLWISGLAALLTTFSSALVAFAFAYFRFPGRNLLFALVLATMMLPGDVTMIPIYLIWNHVGLFTEAHSWMPRIGIDTQYPLWVPSLFGSAFYIFLQRQFFLGIPREYFEAARIDGDNYFTMFWRIALPLAKPALIVTFIFEIQAKWFDFKTALIYLTNEKLFTLPLGLKTVLDRFGQGGGGEGEWQVIMAGTVLLTIPMVILFAFFQRYFIRGIATDGRKG